MDPQHNSTLLKNTIDSSMDMIQVFEAVRNNLGQIVDFKWILNNKTSEKYYGNVIGKSLLTMQPGVAKEKIFDTFKKVVETGEPDQSVHHYTHEQFNGWYHQSTVKQNDGVATTTKDVTEIMQAKAEVEQSKTLLQNIINAPNIGIVVYRAIRNERGKIIDFIHDYINRSSKGMLGDDLTGSLLSEQHSRRTADFDSIVQVIETGNVSTYTRELVNEKGQSWFAVTNTPLDQDRVVHTWEDVTAKKQVDDEVKIASQSLQATLDSSMYFIQAFKSVRDASGKIVDFIWLFTNKMWNEHYGDMTGKNLLDENPGVVVTGLFDKLVQVTETGIPVDHEQFYSHEQFDNQWFHQTLVKLGDGFVMNTEDITRRKIAEREVLALKDEMAQKAEDKYRTIFNTITEGLAVLEMYYDQEGNPVDLRWVETNPAFERMIGGVNVIGKSCAEFSTFKLRPLDAYHELLSTGQPQQLEHYDDRNQRWYLTNTSRMGGKGSRLIVKIFDDITKRKNAEIALRQSEKKYRTLFESIDEGFALMELMRNDQGKVIDLVYREVNEAFKRFTGWQNAVGQRGTILMENLEPALLEQMQMVADSNRTYRKEDYVMDLDRWYDVHYSCTGIPGDSCIIAVFKDTTIRKRHERQQELIVSLSDKIRPLTSDSAVIETICQEVGTYFKVARCGYIEVNSEEENMAIRRDWTTANAASICGNWSLTQFDASCLSPYQNGSLIVASGTVSQVRSQDIVAALDTRMNILSSISVQVMNGQEWVASFYLHDTKGRDWSTGEIAFIEELAARIWSAVRRTQTEQALIHAQVAYRLRLEEEVRERTLELHESRDQLKSLLDTTLVQMSILEAVRGSDLQILDFKIKATNHELEKETGRTDLVGKFFAREYPGIKVTGLYDLIVKTVETGVSQSKEYFYPHDGFNKWFNCTFVKLGDGVVSTNMDITARKYAEEEQYRNYLLLKQSEEIAVIGSWDYDLKTTKFTCSDGMYQLFDLAIGSAISPDLYLHYTTPKGRVNAEKIVKKIVEGSGDFEGTLELEISGVIKAFRIKAMVIYDSDGNAEHVLGVDLDISAIHQAEEKLRHMEAQQQMEIFRVSLSTVEEERHRISESLHNGIAQILYGIKINLGSLVQNISTQEFAATKIYVDKLLTEVISETRRISHELMPTSLEEFGLKSAIDDICQQFANVISFKCRTTGLHRRLEKYMELAIYRTAQELISNVIKHAEATACTVRVDVRQREILIEITDNGKGIKSHSTRKPGIGLAAIRSKIKLLNGDMQIDSEPGKGTRVEVRIPQTSPKVLR